MRARAIPKQSGFQGEQLRQAVDAQRRDANQLPFVQGNTFGSLVVPAGATKVINHGLKHVPQGWVVIDLIGAGPIRRTDWSASTITLANDGASDATVKILVF